MSSGIAKSFRRTLCICAALLPLAGGCTPGTDQPSWVGYKSPDWRNYRAEAQVASTTTAFSRRAGKSLDVDRFTFADLKTESDSSLARRLLGENGKRIAYVDRQRDRWKYYLGDNDAIEEVDLYTHPDVLGSQYGLCGTEKYTFKFSDDGRISSVSMTERFGVEGDIFQKSNFDWNFYEHKMCADASAAHAPSYFPASDVFESQTISRLLVAVIDLSASTSKTLPFKLECRSYDRRRSCNVREYLASIKLKDIDESSTINCPITPIRENQDCFTVKVGKNKLGAFPKYITITGSDYMNNVMIESVKVVESFTMS